MGICGYGIVKGIDALFIDIGQYHVVYPIVQGAIDDVVAVGIKLAHVYMCVTIDHCGLASFLR